MKVIIGFLCVVLAIAEAGSDPTVKKYMCLYFGETKCMLHHVYYNRSSSISYVFPANQTYIQIGLVGWSKGIDSVVEIFDPQLYQELGQPPAVEIINVGMKHLVIPGKLKQANFDDNKLHSFEIETITEQPAITYLDLSRNYLSNTTNVSSLVNLETLILISNDITELAGQPFANLNKLKYLYLNYNRITTISSKDFPYNLIILTFFSNDIETIESDLNLPLLESLNLENNKLSHLNLQSLEMRMPKLREMFISGNHFPYDQILDYIAALKRLNISIISDGDTQSCHYTDMEIEGICTQNNPKHNSWLKATMLSLLTIVMGIGLVLAIMWVYRAMNK